LQVIDTSHHRTRVYCPQVTVLTEQFNLVCILAFVLLAIGISLMISVAKGRRRHSDWQRSPAWRSSTTDGMPIL